MTDEEKGLMLGWIFAAKILMNEAAQRLDPHGMGLGSSVNVELAKKLRNAIEKAP